MTGHSITKWVSWADAELENISIDYDEIKISLLEFASRQVRVIRCHGYIGYQLLGFWDEVVVETLDVVDNHGFLLCCKENLSNRYPNGLPTTGQSYRNNRVWSVLVVGLSDGTELLVAANEFTLE
jgi:hypothetical protein